MFFFNLLTILIQIFNRCPCNYQTYVFSTPYGSFNMKLNRFYEGKTNILNHEEYNKRLITTKKSCLSARLYMSQIKVYF